MKNIPFYFIVILFILTSCSTGKNALQKGDYFFAVSKAVERLKTAPDNKKAINVLKEGYPMALDWSQEEMDLVLSSNSSFKWEGAISLMRQVNLLSGKIRRTPAARKIIKNTKNYSSELNMALEKAAAARYNAGRLELEQNSRESARFAFDHFIMANNFIHGYKDVLKKLDEAKNMATRIVILEVIPVNTKKYKLSSEFLYDQVFEFLNLNYPEKSFVHFYSPKQADKLGFKHPDFIVRMEFFDFSVGNLIRNEKEEHLEKKVKIETKDTTKVEYNIYKATLKTFTDEVLSGGTLRFNIIEFETDRLVSDELINGSFSWINDYAIFVGDIEALNNNQRKLIKRKAMPLPQEQYLFIEFTKPIYNKVTTKLNRFFRKYN